MTLLAAVAVGSIAGCGGSSVGPKGEGTAFNPPLRHQDAAPGCCAGTVFRTRATGYYPASNAMEGGHFDRKGKRLRTLQDFIDGRASYVSVAMDASILPYGSKICIPSLNAEYGKAIPFRVVDTGGAFRKKGTSRIDICTRTRRDAHAKGVNKSFDIVICDP